MSAAHDDLTPGPVTSVTDVFGSAAAYEAMHTLTLSTSTVVAANTRYYAYLRGESGTNSETQLRLFSLRSTCDIPTIDPWVQ